jgi:hypothetical protein
MSFPASLAQTILQKALEIPPLVDEIYLQILKQSNQCPVATSRDRSFQLLCMMAGTAPPSPAFELHLINFLMEFAQCRSHGAAAAAAAAADPGSHDLAGSDALADMAEFILRRLQGSLESGPSGFIPSAAEIHAYKERPPILATIELVDGTVLCESLPISPDMTCGKVRASDGCRRAATPARSAAAHSSSVITGRRAAARARSSTARARAP